MHSYSIPTVSVCIPTYCGSTHLGAAIDSVLNQDFTDFELIIIDDNSPDQTSDVVLSYEDSRIRYIKNSMNLGPEVNWNKCLTESKGKYFKLLPHDDVLAHDCLSRQVDILENDPNECMVLVFCARNIIDQKGNVITTRRYPRAKTGVIASQSLIKKSIRRGTNLLGEPAALLFRKSLAETIGGFDGSISYIIDLDYWFRLLLKGDAFYINQPLVSFRVAPGSWRIDIGVNQSDDFIRFMSRCAQTPSYSLTFIDTLLGRLMAKVNNYLRLLFYKIYIIR